MFITKGSERIVVCLPTAGFVVKLPKIRPIQFIQDGATTIFFVAKYRKSIRNEGVGRWFTWLFSLSEEGDQSVNIRHTLLNGVYANWVEYKLWKKTKSNFLIPTYFSFFGICNIQKYGKPLEMQDKDIWAQLLKLTDGAVRSNSHHFSEKKNFANNNGKAVMIDYGARGVRDVILKYGQVLSTSFQINHTT